MSASIYLLTLGVFFGTVLLVFGMRYSASIFTARARSASDNDYRALAERSAAVHAEGLAKLSALQAEVALIGVTLTSVERILKQVE